MFTDTNAIMCYHCNSAYDPRCGDPFDSFSLGQVNCSVTPKPEHITEEPTLCRKMKQRGGSFVKGTFCLKIDYIKVVFLNSFSSLW